MGIGTDTVRDIGQHIQHTTVEDIAVRDHAAHTGHGIAIPAHHHGGDTQRPENLQDVERLTLDHHLIGHTGSHNQGEQGTKTHADLHDHPERTVVTDKGGIGQELVGGEDDIINLLLKKLYADTRRRQLTKGIHHVAGKTGDG